MRLLRGCKSIIGALCLLPSPLVTLSAQSSADRTPATVIVVPTLKEGRSDALVIRRHNATPHDVIVIKKSKLSNELLAEAVQGLPTPDE